MTSTTLHFDALTSSHPAACSDFARETQARIVAEGMESAAELRMLKSLGAGQAQGYFLARPTSLTKALRKPYLDMITDPGDCAETARIDAG